VLGAGTVDETVVTALIGAGRSDVQYALADAVAVGDARGVFELVSRLVQEGQDLRHVTNEVLAHFRNLLLVKTAPGQTDLLDVTDEESERLTAQAAKYTAGELGRAIALLIDAQTDMRWTTSPRLSLELALIRATIPETDATPEALVSRLERLERVAGITPGSTPVGSGAASPGSGSPPNEPPSGAPAAVGGSQSPSDATPAPSRRDGEAAARRAADPSPPKSASRSKRPTESDEASRDEEAASSAAEPSTEPEGVTPVLGAGTGAVDVTMLRASWPTVIGHLRSQQKAVLPSFLESGTPAAFDGQTLEIVFPPDRRLAVQKVQEREGELRQALQDLFGIAPTIRCEMRNAVVDVTEPVEDEPLSEEEALAHLSAELGATPASEDGA
jgi:DNA polymerase III subunit gamma/tau